VSKIVIKTHWKWQKNDKCTLKVKKIWNFVKVGKRSHVPCQSLKKCHETDEYPHIDLVIIHLTNDTFLQEHQKCS